MADWTIWHLFTGKDASKTAAPLAHLAQAGCQLQPWRPSARNGEYGLAFFDQPTPDIADVLQQTSCGGLRRVLAISVEDRPLPAKDVQFLLIGPIWLMSHVYRRLGVTF